MQRWCDGFALIWFGWINWAVCTAPRPSRKCREKDIWAIMLRNPGRCSCCSCACCVQLGELLHHVRQQFSVSHRPAFRSALNMCQAQYHCSAWGRGLLYRLRRISCESCCSCRKEKRFFWQVRVAYFQMDIVTSLSRECKHYVPLAPYIFQWFL